MGWKEKREEKKKQEEKIKQEQAEELAKVQTDTKNLNIGTEQTAVQEESSLMQEVAQMPDLEFRTTILALLQECLVILRDLEEKQ